MPRNSSFYFLINIVLLNKEKVIGFKLYYIHVENALQYCCHSKTIPLPLESGFISDMAKNADSKVGIFLPCSDASPDHIRTDPSSQPIAKRLLDVELTQLVEVIREPFGLPLTKV